MGRRWGTTFCTSISPASPPTNASLWIVRVELRGIAPGIAAGGVLVQPIHNLTVECLVIAVPESIRVNIDELQIGQAIHVKDLALPEGVIVKNDPEAIVVQVSPQQAEEAARRRVRASRRTG